MHRSVKARALSGSVTFITVFRERDPQCKWKRRCVCARTHLGFMSFPAGLFTTCLLATYCSGPLSLCTRSDETDEECSGCARAPACELSNPHTHLHSPSIPVPAECALQYPVHSLQCSRYHTRNTAVTHARFSFKLARAALTEIPGN